MGALTRLLVVGCWFVVLLAACSRISVDRNEWQKMSADDRVLYVKTLIGAEKAKEAKGGRAKTYDRAPEVYVKEIDRAYERGEQRDVADVFAELAR